MGGEGGSASATGRGAGTCWVGWGGPVEDMGPGGFGAGLGKGDSDRTTRTGRLGRRLGKGDSDRATRIGRFDSHGPQRRGAGLAGPRHGAARMRPRNRGAGGDGGSG